MFALTNLPSEPRHRAATSSKHLQSPSVDVGQPVNSQHHREPGPLGHPAQSSLQMTVAQVDMQPQQDSKEELVEPNPPQNERENDKLFL